MPETATISATDLRRKTHDVIQSVYYTRQPVAVTLHGKRPTVVIVSYDDWQGLEHFYITRHPGISGGEPIIRGTRITVQRIVELVKAGESVQDILDALPHLTAAQVHDALSYYYDHQAEIDRLIEASQPEQVLKPLGLRLERVAEGIAFARKATDR
ncbi:MAG: hypothetical protein CVU38_07890 [Chloroflexi bacterium HGW-Chloroflexi-1]|nr:MAG: hypothetical protein CVU38_07890 [Chloroflexi bacterium HGW-Chloroflexi-1]